ncbi:MAG: deoxyguanosinetriphosphate triphosphohydrolase [Rhodospirillaceae bacterium]|nr:deoxyguanosinetriphosphate triphosphohydrolase [Rhodospirillaceae bacterium]|tara:strand:- start:1014 stop:2192 length:1179 start_codon:yes stop_codon:yes gene_type:complete
MGKTNLSNKYFASLASKPESSRGRLYNEPESSTRTCFQRDRDRIIHSAAFRRLEYKTQVFVYHEGDYYRTRLTHSLETAQIARSICRVLGLNEDLGEALALAHDLGHTPFGHAGEEALDKVMQPWGGFSHNAQTLRILTELEHKYADFDGLNLSWETLEGVAKHNGPLLNSDMSIPESISKYSEKHNLLLDTWPGLEAQVAAIADDIAYNNHDVDDGLRAGLFSIEDVSDVSLVGPIFAEVKKTKSYIDDTRLIHEAIRRMIGYVVTDVIEESRLRLIDSGCESADDVRFYGKSVVSFSEEMKKHDSELKDFLFRRMYQHYKVNRMASKAKRVVIDLFELFIHEPQCLPGEWFRHCEGPNNLITARLVADYIAGMTDRYAFLEHKRLFEISL